MRWKLRIIDLVFPACLVLLAAPATGYAGAGSRVRLRYEVSADAKGCPTRKEVARAVESALGRSAWDDNAKEAVSVRIVLTTDKLQATIEATDNAGRAKGARLLEAPLTDCAELGRAVVLALSIAIDPSQALKPPPPAPAASQAAAPTSPPSSAPAATMPAASRNPRRRGPPQRIFVELSSHAALGSTPSTAPGLRLAVGWGRGWLSLLLEGRFDAKTDEALRVGSVDATLLGGGAAACARWKITRTCAVLSAGALLGGGEGLVESRRVTTLYLAAGVRFSLQVPLYRALYLALDTQLEVPLRRVRYVEVGSGASLWDAPAVAALLGGGLGLRFD